MTETYTRSQIPAYNPEKVVNVAQFLRLTATARKQCFAGLEKNDSLLRQLMYRLGEMFDAHAANKVAKKDALENGLLLDEKGNAYMSGEDMIRQSKSLYEGKFGDTDGPGVISRFKQIEKAAFDLCHDYRAKVGAGIERTFATAKKAAPAPQ